MLEYHKIPNAWKRNTTTNRIDLHQWTSPEVEYLRNLDWIATEKVDGTNIRIGWDGHKVSLGGRTDRADLPNGIVEHLRHFLTPQMEEVFEQTFGINEVVLFGEGYGAKIQKSGGLYRKDNAFIMFDVWISGMYLKRDAVEDIGNKLNIPVVPVAITGNIEAIRSYVASKPASQIAQSPMIIEGVVAVPVVPMYSRKGERIVVKIKVRDFD